jgi:UDP-2-acetamido-3-amino-2,3-dideoxy-glucuronate N-acetyltransferase
MGSKVQIDSTSRVWARSVNPMVRVDAFTHVLHDAELGYQCHIGRYCVIEDQARIGQRAVVEDYVTVPSGVNVGEQAVIGSHVVFADNAGQYAAVGERTLIGEGARIGANATVLRGITVGRHALIDPGSLVLRDVPDYARVSGNPAQQDGWVCACGKSLNLPVSGDKHATCSCGRSYRLLDDQLSKHTQLGE